MVDKALFSSASEEWETPQAFFDKLNEEFRFDMVVIFSGKVVPVASGDVQAG